MMKMRIKPKPVDMPNLAKRKCCQLIVVSLVVILFTLCIAISADN